LRDFSEFPQTGKILLVDDMPANLRLLASVLDAHYSVSAATNGSDALELVERIRPDLILLDVEMAGMDGYEVCRKLKDNLETRRIPVIFVTGRADESDEILGLQLGAVDYLTKPLNPAIVLARVHTHLELKRYSDLLEQHAYMDGLTGLPNRRRFEQFANQAWQPPDRQPESVAIVLLDIDHFKHYNDGYGHLAGDRCLRKVANLLLGARRRHSDLLARFGGEEFICIMPGANIEAALDQGERFRQAVAEAMIEHLHVPDRPHLSISVGVAVASPVLGDIEALVERADQALYQAKNQGRNRVLAA
jgi:diguanylate cyclase (GGDEF)-like protein